MSRITRIPVFILLLPLCLATAVAQEPRLAPNAPKDKPVVSSSIQQIEEAMAPHVTLARATYPQAKERFMRGLGPGESFFLTTKLFEMGGRVEQVFVAVRSIENGQVHGRIWSHVNTVRGYRYRDPYSFPEERVVDWLITKPDGSEEGNYVGKFLDSYQRK